MHARRSLSCLAALATVLVAAGELGASLHEALTVHAVCAEHGEPIHVAAGGGSVSPLADSVRRSAPAPPAPPDAHAHCSLLAGRTRLAPPAPPSPWATGLDVLPSRAGASPVAAHAGARFRLAPKTSPPRIG